MNSIPTKSQAGTDPRQLYIFLSVSHRWQRIVRKEINPLHVAFRMHWCFPPTLQDAQRFLARLGPISCITVPDHSPFLYQYPRPWYPYPMEPLVEALRALSPAESRPLLILTAAPQKSERVDFPVRELAIEQTEITGQTLSDIVPLAHRLESVNLRHSHHCTDHILTPDCLGLLAQHCTALRSLRVAYELPSDAHPPQARYVFPALSHLATTSTQIFQWMHAPALQSFEFLSRHSADSSSLTDLHHIAPRLTRLVQANSMRSMFQISDALSFRQLQELDVYLDAIPSDEQVQSLAEACPNLTHLALRYFGGHEVSKDPVSSHVFPCLRSLTLQYHSFPSVFLHAPHLERIEFRDIEKLSLDLRLLCRAAPQLKTVIFQRLQYPLDITPRNGMISHKHLHSRR